MAPFSDDPEAIAIREKVDYSIRITFKEAKAGNGQYIFLSLLIIFYIWIALNVYKWCLITQPLDQSEFLPMEFMIYFIKDIQDNFYKPRICFPMCTS